MKKNFRREEGQSIIIVAAGLVALIAFLALVVDAGNAYVQRRQVQNAIDAASQAGTIALTQALRDPSVTYTTIDAKVKNYANANGVSKQDVNVYFVGQDAGGNKVVIKNPVSNYGNVQVNSTLVYNGVTYNLVGVQAEGTKKFDTFFASVINITKMDVGAASASYAKCGACNGNGLFPITVASGLFDGLSQPPPTEQSNSSYYYVIWENKKNMTGVSAGNFGYIQWPGNSPSATTLASNMNNAENNVSGSWQVGDSVSGDPGVSAGSEVMAALQNRVSTKVSDPNCLKCVTLPVYDTYSDNGNNRTYRIKGFARFRISCYHFNNSAGGSGGTCQGSYNPGDKFIQATLQNWIEPSASGGCADFGVCTVKSNPPITNTTRSLIGSVKINQLTRTNTTPTNVHVPVDVMYVLDLSPSMNNNFDNNSTGNDSARKITAARAALKIFNKNFVAQKNANPSYTDQLGLVSFPLTTYGSEYTTDCPPQKSTKYEVGKLDYALGGNVSWMNTISSTTATMPLPNGNTPTAGAIRLATQTLLGATHRAGNIPVMILATDGRANVRVDTSKFNGDSIDLNSCNNGALTDATNEATVAKSDNNHDGLPDVTIFVIASGSEYVSNPTFSSFFKAIATVDTDPSLPHFIGAGNSTDLQAAFTSISNRISQIGTESCKIIQTEAFANGFNLTATNQSSGRTYPVTTTSSGEFVIPNIDPGTYTFTTNSNVINGLNYNVFTLGVGGADGSSPITVGNNSGTYRTDLFLRSGTQATCQ